MSDRLFVYDGPRGVVCKVSLKEADDLVANCLAVPVGRKKIRGIALVDGVSLSYARASVSSETVPICQGSRTVMRVRVRDFIIFEHHKRRCEAYGQLDRNLFPASGPHLAE